VNERDLFNAALQIEDPAARAASLDKACGDDIELRQRVEALLEAFGQAGSFMQQPAVAAAATSDVSPPGPSLNNVRAERPGTVIGPYKLLQQIGEGGMGTVFMAEQTQPVQRKVALKIIKPGMDSKQVIARFEAERQALAMMDHVNIARVFDGGTCGAGVPPASDSDAGGTPAPQGRPYFVMELVHGVPITKYCDDNHLTPRERLELFVPVCQAIQHAHQKGIIHRDIKPSNVMVTLYDGKPVPKVIDFGVAKATEQKLTERTLFTQYGTMVGTLEYMSPEQAEMSALGVDTRSDIYSLGVLLYELLTGSTPLTHKRMKEAAYAEILRMIKEEEPPKPSTRLSDSGEALASISEQRHMEPAKLTKLVRGELDWIVMKTLEKDRNRRYETANGLAADVQRYLKDEPVQACPPSVGYRLRKFVRRNRGPVLAASLVLVALVVGLIGTTWGLVRAIKAEGDALASAEAEKKAKEAEAERADGERRAKESAQKRLAQIEKGNEILGSIFNDLDPLAEEKEGKPLRALLGDRLDAAVQQLQGEAVGDPVAVARLQRALGTSLFGLGYAAKAVDLFAKARATCSIHLGPDHADTLGNMNNLAGCYCVLGRHAEARKLLEETVALRKAKLGPDHLETLQSMTNLASTYYALGRYADALKLQKETLALQKARLGLDHRNTLKSMHNLAVIYYALGRHAEALKLEEEILPLFEANFGRDHPETLNVMGNLAAGYYFLGQHAEALKLNEQTLALWKARLGPDHPHTLMSMNNLSNSYVAFGRHTDALKLREQTLALRKAKLGLDHPDTLSSMYNLANSYTYTGRKAEALKLHEETLALYQAKLGPDHPDTLQSLQAVAYPRLRHFASLNDAAGCRTVAEMLEKLKLNDAASLYNAACFRAVTAAVIKKDARIPAAAAARLAGEEIDRAMAWLKRAVAAGFSDAAHMAKDTDLDVLRDRQDFQKLLAELKAGKSKDKK